MAGTQADEAQYFLSYPNAARRSQPIQPYGKIPVFDASAQTKYPIVLAHGMAGFNQEPKNFNYWYMIPDALAAQGARVYVTQVDAFGQEARGRGQSGQVKNAEGRGGQLLEQIERILDHAKVDKVNLIGHSQGTLDSRYVAANSASAIASVTGVSGPNRGSAVADLVEQLTNNPAGRLAKLQLAIFVDGFFAMMQRMAGGIDKQDALAGLRQLTSKKMQAFNKKFPGGLDKPVDNGIRYYSWTGVGHLTMPLWRGVRFPLAYFSDVMLELTGWAFKNAPNDGLVSQSSARLGAVIGDSYDMNHFNTVNQVAGKVSRKGPSPVELFLEHAVRLKAAGL